MRLLRHLPLLLVALGAGCVSTGPGEVGLDEEFVLAPNQTIRIVGTDLTIGFRRVVGDNRCPIDVLCVVEGSAGVELDLFRSNTRQPVVLESRIGFETWTDGTYQVRLLAVEPPPTAGREIPADAYRARLIARLTLQ
jgi:hypothetical protein